MRLTEKSDRSSDRDDVERFRHLAQELLKYSTQGLLRKDFLPKVSARIMEFSGSDATELWVKEGPHKHFRCSVSGTKKMPFGFILVPCLLGEETAPRPADRNEPGLERICCDVIKGSIDPSNPCVTERGSFWTDAASEAMGLNETVCQTASSPPVRLPEPFKSIALIPIRLEEECIGLLQLKSTQRDCLSIHEQIS